eukprot:35712-Eustigmatos_ZCMA.PRE.1
MARLRVYSFTSTLHLTPLSSSARSQSTEAKQSSVNLCSELVFPSTISRAATLTVSDTNATSRLSRLPIDAHDTRPVASPTCAP